MNRRIRTGLVAGLLLAGTALSACGSSDEDGDKFASGDSDKTSDASTVVVGSANFPESELLMQIYAQALEAKGITVETKPNIGTRQTYIKAFEGGEIDLLPEYNGALLSFLSPGGEVPEGVSSPEDVFAALPEVLPEGSQVLPQSAAEDKDTLTVTAETAAKYDLTTVEDLAPVADELTMGAAPEWQKNYAGAVGLKKLYDIEFKQFKPLDAGGPLTVSALKDGTIDVANVYTTNSAIPANKWVTLTDTKNLYTAQNIVPLVRTEVVNADLESALEGVSQALTTENLTAALAKVTDDKQSSEVVAKEFLAEHDLD